jgi:ATP-dependent 26S proteasome regulatory subunit
MRQEQPYTSFNESQTDAFVYSDNRFHLSDELRKLDLLILQRVLLKGQARNDMAGIPINPKLFVSFEEVEYLLGIESDSATVTPAIAEVRDKLKVKQQRINSGVEAALKAGVFLALPQLALLFSLSSFELQILIICLAPELRHKYDTLYVYLQNDIARKKPSVHMILDLLCQDEADQWQARRYFSEDASLFKTGILQVVPDLHSPSGNSDLSRLLKISPRILDFILQNNQMDASLTSVAALQNPAGMPQSEILIDAPLKDHVQAIATGYLEQALPRPKMMAFYFYGPIGVGKQKLALEICRKVNCALLYVDIEMILASGAQAQSIMRTAFREGLLQQAMLYFDHIDSLFSQDTQSCALLKMLVSLIREFGWITVLAGEKRWDAGDIFTPLLLQSFHIPVPPVQLRQISWQQSMTHILHLSRPQVNRWSGELARQFRLTPGQVRAAVEFVNCHYLLGNQKTPLTQAMFFAAARNQSNRKLSELAVKIVPKLGWDNIVLKEEKITQLKEICNQVRHRHKVFSQWGFHEKLSHGRGLSVLFAGPPGTGKTLAAEVMATELQLDLYKIDLSSIVSKYIGETEKNLSRIFAEAETSNAILFFDEADALFGKRTEVSDAHDRYANIETSYLLQKMDEYEGIVILATNLRNNMDDAFTRRIRFIIQFPFPDEAGRCKIWQTHFPKSAPLGTAIDYLFLARHLPLSGGNIRNIVLNAAFNAAQNGGSIEMEHILKGARLEFEKIGKLWKDIKPTSATKTLLGES